MDEPDVEVSEAEDLTDEERADLLRADAQPLAVSYSGQDFDVAGLVQRLNKDSILIPQFGHEDARVESAGFQRSFVWNRPQMDRFIESLLLGYPIPGIFLIRQPDKRYLVLDGQQRLRTLQYFYRGIHAGSSFALKNVSEPYVDLTYNALDEEQRRLVDDTFIQATIVTTDGSEKSLEAIYQIFERLNAGGTQLTPHEIRMALYSGEFVDFVNQLNLMAPWRLLYGRKSPRVRDHELVLRILSLYLSVEPYRQPLKKYLNKFVAEHRSLLGIDSKKVATQFTVAAELLADAVGRAALRPYSKQMNVAWAEAIFVGLLRRIDRDPSISAESVRGVVEKLHDDPEMRISTTQDVSSESHVKMRLKIATDHFSEA